MEKISNELKLNAGEVRDLIRNGAQFIALKNIMYCSSIIKEKLVNVEIVSNDILVHGTETGGRDYISDTDFIEAITTLEKYNAYIIKYQDRINEARALIGKVVKIKGYQAGGFENSQKTALNLSAQIENFSGVIVDYDTARDNFYVAFDCINNHYIGSNGRAFHSANRVYHYNTCITYENSADLFSNVLEIQDSETAHRILVDSYAKRIDLTLYPDAILAYTYYPVDNEYIKISRIYENIAHARRNGYRKCKKCGEYVNEAMTYKIGTNNYCWHCYEKMEREGKIEKCAICGKIERVDNFKVITNASGENVKLCATCTRKWVKTCEECGKEMYIYDNDSTEKVYQDRRGNKHYFCETCAETSEKLTTCAVCGKKIYKSEYNDHNFILDNQYMCYNCYTEETSKYTINSYHFKSEWTPQKLETEEDPIFYGFELETENGTSATTEYLRSLKQAFPPIVFEHDGSLHSYGAFETISEPLSMGYIYAHKDNIKKMLSLMEEYGAKSHDTTTCGLHIHFTRKFFNEEAENKLLTIFERFQNELIRFSRRKYSEIMHWTKFNGTDLKTIDTENIKKIKSAYLANRYNCINLTNKKTIECRLFRGTLRFETFIACFELVNNIALYVLEKTAEEVNACKFIDLIKYKPTEFLWQYCIDRHIVENN